MIRVKRQYLTFYYRLEGPKKGGGGRRVGGGWGEGGRGKTGLGLVISIGLFFNVTKNVFACFHVFCFIQNPDGATIKSRISGHTTI